MALDDRTDLCVGILYHVSVCHRVLSQDLTELAWISYQLDPLVYSRVLLLLSIALLDYPRFHLRTMDIQKL